VSHVRPTRNSAGKANMLCPQAIDETAIKITPIILCAQHELSRVIFKDLDKFSLTSLNIDEVLKERRLLRSVSHAFSLDCPGFSFYAYNTAGSVIRDT
jgi:hypothetical protein